MQDPGLTPKAISELFAVLDRDSSKYSFSVSVYMLELYQDDLADLLLAPAKAAPGVKVGSVERTIDLEIAQLISQSINQAITQGRGWCQGVQIYPDMPLVQVSSSTEIKSRAIRRGQSEII